MSLLPLFLSLVFVVAAGGCGTGVMENALSSTLTTGGGTGSGGGSDPGGDDPSVASFHDSLGNIISDNALVAHSDTFCCQFDVAIDASVCSADTVSLSCNNADKEGTISSTTDTDGIADNECCFNPTDLLPQNSSCTFTCQEQDVIVTTGCASSDDYTTDTSSCYRFNNTTNQEDEFSNVEGAAISIADGELSFDMTTTATQASNGFNNISSLAKDDVVGDFDVQVEVETMLADNDNASVKFMIVNSMNEGLSTMFVCGLHRNRCTFGGIDGGSNLGTSDDNACTLGGGSTANVVIRVVRAGNTFQCFRKLSSESSFSQVGTDLTFSNFQDDVFVAIAGISASNAGTGLYVLDDLVFNSGGVEGQD